MNSKKAINISIYIIIFVSIFSFIISRPISDLDEIWNYNFAKNVADGRVPYRDFNMVITPMLSLLCGIILKITTNHLLIMRIIAAISCSFIIFLIYQILKQFNVNNKLMVICLSFIFYLYNGIICIDYNWISLLIALVIVFLEIREYEKNKESLIVNTKLDIFIGILAGMSFLTKQTSGLLICIVVLGNKLIDVKNIENFKVYLKKFLFRIIGILIPLAITLIYLLVNNAFDDFLSYTLKGASSFTNYISYFSLFDSCVTGVLAILVPTFMLIELYKTVIKDRNKKMYYLFVYGLAIFIITFPISNKIHFVIGATPIISILIIEANTIIEFLYKKFIKNKNTLKKFLIIILYIISFIFAFIIILSTLKNYINYAKSNHSQLNNFRYLPIDENIEQMIKFVDDYIINNNKDVKILDSSAAIYMIPINKYNKDFDMFNTGNFGYKGEDRLKKEVSSSNNVEYLILKEKYPLNWQAPLNIIEYVKKSKKRIGEIAIFDIYN